MKKSNIVNLTIWVLKPTFFGLKAIVNLTGVDISANAEEIVGRDIMLDADSDDQESEDFTHLLPAAIYYLF